MRPSTESPAPFFSILIPSYNRPEFVGAAVASVLASDFQDFEIIVSDDCSPRQAEIRAVLEPALADPRMHFRAQATNLREPANRAFLHAEARGDWQVLLSDDDTLYPHALRALAAAITANPGTDLFTFGYTLIDELDRVRYSRRAPRAIRIHRDGDPAVLREFLCSQAFPYWFYQPATFCCHGRVRERITPNSNIGMGDDLQFLFDYVNNGGAIGVVPDVLMCYRKMDVRATHLQLNQSAPPLSNPYTRYRMLVEMEQRRDICPAFRAIVGAAEFRRRFVYDALLGETSAVGAAAARIGIGEPHLSELLAYSGRRRAQWARVSGLLARCRFFVGLFGVAGGVEILRVATQRSRAGLTVRKTALPQGAGLRRGRRRAGGEPPCISEPVMTTHLNDKLPLTAPQVITTSVSQRRVLYAEAVYDEREIEAVIDVLRNRPHQLMNGPAVFEFERRVAALFGKMYGVMTNSGSSAITLGLASLNLPPGSEVITPACTFSTTVAPIVQLGLIPAFVDVEPDTFQIDAAAVEALITPKTRAIMAPNLIGNLPDWPALRAIADRHGLLLVEDSADTIGSLVNGAPTGALSDVSTTSFYASHVMTCGGFGGMVCFHDTRLTQRAQLLRGWGRSSALTGESEKIQDRFSAKLEGMDYDAKFLFDGLGYNFLPSEMGAAFGLVQLEKLPEYIEARIRNFTGLSQFFSRFREWFVLPRQRANIRTPWLAVPLIVRDDAPFSRRDLQVCFETAGVQTRPIFGGNILRHAGFAGITRRDSAGGYPNADRVMRGGILLGCHQGMDASDLAYICEVFLQFSRERGA